MTRIEEVDPSRIDCEANLFQGAFWARFKRRRGHDIQTFSIDHRGRKSAMLVVHRPCAADAAFGYVPHGPDIDIPEDRQGPFLEEVAEKIRYRLPDRCRFLRFDLPWQSPYATETRPGCGRFDRPEPRVRELRMNFGCRRWNLRKAPTDMQAPDTVILDLSPPAEQIFCSMHKKARYCVRSSFRQGVVVGQGGPEDLPAWHRMYVEMAERKHIAAESGAYFRGLFSEAGNRAATEIRLYRATFNGRLVAGSIFAFHADSSQATYLFSASSPEGRTRTAAYAVLWRAIQDAKAGGCRWFDLFGIPAEDTPAHPMHGLYRFKKRFGGRVRHLRGSWDYPFDEERYPLLALAGTDTRLIGAKRDV
jgi:lipid II:glycine glycyltransferase (peptidoglycan interpeptide bridge formation enzyme)